MECPEYLEDQVEWIFQRLNEDPPDVFVPNLVLAGLLAAKWVKKAGVPTVAVIHSDDSFYRGVLAQFVFGNESARVSAIVCVSEELERQARVRVLAGLTIRTIPCGVPVPEIAVARIPGRLRLAYVGRLTEEQKRISEVARAFCNVTRLVSGTDALIIGDGPDRANVKAVLAAECVGSAVKLAGRVGVDEIQELLRTRDVIVLLSDYEGLPIALMEGMACGCVPVALRTRSGIPELIHNDENGFIVEDRDASFVDAIRRLRDDPELWQEMSGASKALILRSYSDAYSNSQWEQLLRDLAVLNGRSKSFEFPRRLRIRDGHPGLHIHAQLKPRVSLGTAMYRRTRIAAGALRRTILGKT